MGVIELARAIESSNTILINRCATEITGKKVDVMVFLKRSVLEDIKSDTSERHRAAIFSILTRSITNEAARALAEDLIAYYG
jgi:hypothetical protein